MADFNPDAYLAKIEPQKKPEGFDPDAYLAKVGQPEQKDRPWYDISAKGVGQAFKNYIPSLPSKEQLSHALDISGPGILQGIKNVPSTAGTIAGGLLSENPVAKAAGAGLLSAAGKGVERIASGEDATDDQGNKRPWYSVTPSGLMSAAKEQGKAGVSGALAEMGGQAAGKAIESIPNVARSAKEFANKKAFKSSGAMLKDFRSAEARGQVDKIGKFMLDNDLVKAGDTFEDVAEKAESLRKSAGDRISDAYSRSQRALAGLKGDVEPIQQELPGMTKEGAGGQSEMVLNEPKGNIVQSKEQKAISDAGFNPTRDKAEIMSAAKSSLGSSVKAKTALNNLEEYLDGLAKEHGDTTLDPRTANDIKGSMDDEINYSRNPLTKAPGSEKAYSAARNVLSKKIDAHIEAIGKATGDDELLSQLKTANKEYGNASAVRKMAQDRVSRESANRAFGLTDTIAGSGGATAGAIGGLAVGHPGAGAALGAVGTGLANKVGRTYGNAAMASVANKLGSSLEKAAPALETSSPAVQAAIKSMLTKKRGD